MTTQTAEQLAFEHAVLERERLDLEIALQETGLEQLKLERALLSLRLPIEPQARAHKMAKAKKSNQQNLESAKPEPAKPRTRDCGCGKAGPRAAPTEITTDEIKSPGLTA